MALVALLCLAYSVGTVLGTPRVRGDPVWQIRDQAQNYRQVDYSAAPPRHTVPSQEPSLQVQLPQSLLESLLADPKYSSLIQEANQDTVMVEVVPEPVRQSPTYQAPPQYSPQPSSSQTKVQAKLQQTLKPKAFRRPAVITANHAPVYPEGPESLIDVQVGHLLRASDVGRATLINVRPKLPSITVRLPDNYTLIRPNVVDTFRCDDKLYGYYADEDNDCQVFHICLPMKQLYPKNFTSEVIYQFSFICPFGTSFSQDTWVCAWTSEALPCDQSKDVYWLAENLFKRVQNDDGTETWAEFGSSRETTTESSAET